MFRIIVHEYTVPKGPLTHRECTVPKSLLEDILEVFLEEEQTDYFMGTDEYNMLLKMPQTRANLILHKGGQYETPKS
tara:strand:+ start:47 stop:277 length:231 start_codon:yes stop_codon:yes gene_type:complete